MYTLEHAKEENIAECYRIIDDGRQFQRQQGFVQWTDDYPNPDTIRQDVTVGNGYVLKADGAIAGYMCIDFSGEPAYEAIDGKWRSDAPYAVIHRMAFCKEFRGRGLVDIAFEKIDTLCRTRGVHYLRADTDFPNERMQHILTKNGFIQCGVIVFQGSGKLAYDKILECKSVRDRGEIKPQTIRIRDAVPDDADRLLEIYAYYVEHTAITFEYAVPTPDEFRARIEQTLRRYPYLVIEADGVIRGYAYAGAFKERAAYDRCCETTIYLEHTEAKRGLGRKLYEALEERLSEMGILNLYACIGYTDAEDEYLNKNSAEFHAHLGYATVGTFRKCGYKFGRWYDMIWMEKIIGEHKNDQPAVHGAAVTSR